MKVTQRTKAVLAMRRQQRELYAKGYEYVGEGGGKLWEIYRGGRCGQRITDAIVDVAGMGVYVKIEPTSQLRQGERA
jgi:hypothetical protein